MTLAAPLAGAADCSSITVGQRLLVLRREVMFLMRTGMTCRVEIAPPPRACPLEMVGRNVG